MRFEEVDEFGKDLKKLIKKYRSLNEDLETLKKVIKNNPSQRPPYSYRIEGLGIDRYIVKVKRIACKSMKGLGSNTGLRLVYCYMEENDTITFIEIYHKNEKAVEDRSRILRYFSD